MTGRIVFLGCSLSNEDLSSWTSSLANKLNMPYVNLSCAAGNNMLQVHLLDDYLLGNDYSSSDIFVWQFTGFSRSNLFCSPNLVVEEGNYLTIVDEIAKEVSTSKYDYVPLPNYLGDNLIAILSNLHLSKYRKMLDPYGLCSQESLQMQTVLAKVKLLVAAGHPVVTILGWDTVVDYSQKKTFLRKLKELNVYHVHNPIVQWCLEKNLEFADDLHPLDESSVRWAHTNVLPILQKILTKN